VNVVKNNKKDVTETIDSDCSCVDYVGRDYSKHISSINRVVGQLDGIKKMIQNHRYCVEIMNQLKATYSALKGIELAILKTHLETCIFESFNDKDKFNDKIDEIIALLKKK
jgi:DNA-binding FrmR family transcriptional regulator